MTTEEIIIACQKVVGAKPDGVAGPETWDKIYNRLVGWLPPEPIYTLFADGNHNDTWPPPASMPAFIHKATQGTYFTDEQAPKRRRQFKAMGAKWGWYHFTSGEKPSDQARCFLDYIREAGYSPDDLICLDFEDSDDDGTENMTAEGAQEWIDIVGAALNCKVCVYGSDLLTDALKANALAFPDCPLWIAHYQETPPVLPGNRQWALWQFTENGTPYPDMNRFPGTVMDLRTNWPNNLRTGIVNSTLQSPVLS